MVYENSPYYFRLLVPVFLITSLASCATDERSGYLPDKAAVQLESWEQLLNWYDVTYKNYYGLKGPVKRLIIKPVFLVEGTNKPVSDSWELDFNSKGRLVKKNNLESGQEFYIEYSYSENNLLRFVASYKDNNLWRTSNFIYKGDELVKILFSDKKQNIQTEAKVSKQSVKSGWIESQKLISSPKLPVYTLYNNDGGIAWSSNGDINNGLGELYFIRTVDGVTSSPLISFESELKLEGGYKYNYLENGLLLSVESYNAHKNRLYHRTTYQYNDLQLLTFENKKVLDKSPFNEAIDENVRYDYLKIDDHGNWTRRELAVSSKHRALRYLEVRELEYF